MGLEELADTDLRLVRPDDPSSEGCPVASKTRLLSVDKGMAAVGEWIVRDHASNDMDLSVPQIASVVTRFVACDGGGPIYEMAAVIIDAAAGKIRFEIPHEIRDIAGVYRLTIGLKDADGFIVFTEQGLLSIERGQFGDMAQTGGPPTLREIRTAMADTIAENSLLGDVQYSNEDLVFSLVRPIAQWNETPPPVQPFTCSDFPYRENWMKATMGYLMSRAAQHYMRNKLGMQHGGVAGDDLDKNNEYMSLSRMYLQDWKDFILTKKVELNARQGFGGVN